ncbi:replicative DNA helicase ATP-binding domain protein [Fibrobacter succinogenes subsp. succinogenes S85]|uniref:DnaB helicase domain protein n=1 Tax=Fibrobacter succinogenes (strain ATCC 19169 / S85) TaxID=59374 RepID=C9RQ80_FIBSS|nr:DnaB-like helicase C-terminal domain-containing protein [Fibrobacter succinogenes]ACX74757.1 DnaB helicase domain protein [Fibrobacter succinogenes subsp. succinogenes S85]ADL25761.1 replicative DNA helicase ATP-binding domain protein [Fibrobacter succinogenes subsp. succinogenes S85]
MFKDKMTDSFESLAENEINKAFRYYNYVREFYGYLCDSLDLVFEDDCCEFDPAYAPAEKEFPPTDGIDENSTDKAKALDKMTRAIRAYETMQTIVGAFDKECVEKSAKNCGMLQDTHKFALTSIAQWFPKPSIWREFDDSAQKQLDEYSGNAQCAALLLEPLSLEDAIHKIFVKQKKCLEKFLPQKINNLKKLQAEMERSYTGKADWANRLRRGALTILAAHAGVGIRTFALNVAASAALDDGKGVVYFSLDNCGTRRGEQLLCQYAGVDYSKICEEALDKTETQMLVTSVGKIMHSHLRIEDATNMDLTELAQKARLYKQLKSLDVLIIDYLHLLKIRSSANKAESLKMATWTLKNLAMELNISILILCPLSRAKFDEPKPAPLTELNEVLEITQEADDIWLLERTSLTIVKIADDSTKKIPLCYTHKRGFTPVIA